MTKENIKNLVFLISAFYIIDLNVSVLNIMILSPLFALDPLRQIRADLNNAKEIFV